MRTRFKTASIIMVLMMTLFLRQTAEAMDCQSTGSRCVEEGERMVDGFKVTKCWKYEDSFDCKHPSKDNCKKLREEGCLHVTHDTNGNETDECLKSHDGKCLNYKKNYVCEREIEVEDEQAKIKIATKSQKKKVKCKSDILCASGECFDDDEEGEKERQEENSKDMLDAITQMTVAQEMAKDQVRGDGDTSIISVFKGEAMQCKKNPILKFKDCCGAKPKGKGWGISLGLSRCKADAKAMAERRSAGHCVDLGTYCSEKWPVVGCVAKKHTYCCFTGKLQRIMHEQGRAQLGIGWGAAKNPNCRGFTVEELSKLSFDKIDFSEYYAEVMKKYKAPNIGESAKRVSRAFGNIAKDFASNSDSKLKDKTNQIPFRNKKFNEEVKDEDTGMVSSRPHM